LASIYKTQSLFNTSIVSENGQITIPKETMEKLGIFKGDKLILDLKKAKILISKS